MSFPQNQRKLKRFYTYTQLSTLYKCYLPPLNSAKMQL